MFQMLSPRLLLISLACALSLSACAPGTNTGTPGYPIIVQGTVKKISGKGFSVQDKKSVVFIDTNHRGLLSALHTGEKVTIRGIPGGGRKKSDDYNAYEVTPASGGSFRISG